LLFYDGFFDQGGPDAALSIGGSYHITMFYQWQQVVILQNIYDDSTTCNLSELACQELRVPSPLYLQVCSPGTLLWRRDSIKNVIECFVDLRQAL